MPNVVLTGLPRSGSTLTCHLLNRCADTVALHEPVPISELVRDHGVDALPGHIAAFFADTRRSLLEHRRAISKTVEGRVPDNTFGEKRGADDKLRRSLASRGEVSFEGKDLSPDFTLAIKHNAGFAAMLGAAQGAVSLPGDRAASALGDRVVEQRATPRAAGLCPGRPVDRRGVGRTAPADRRPHGAAVLPAGVVFRAVRQRARAGRHPALRGPDRIGRAGADAGDAVGERPGRAVGFARTKIRPTTRR